MTVVTLGTGVSPGPSINWGPTRVDARWCEGTVIIAVLQEARGTIGYEVYDPTLPV